MSSDDKQKKVDSGRSMLDTYMKKKHHQCQRRSENAEVEYEAKHCPSTSSTAASRNKMDSLSLQKHTSHFVSLKTTIQQLQNTVSEKNELISALEIQNRMLQEGRGDEASSSERHEEKMIQELKGMVEARDTYIQQLSSSLQTRSEELAAALNKENDLTAKIQNLQLEVELVKAQAQEYLGTSKSLRLSFENSNKTIEHLQHDILEKEKKINNLKCKSAEEIKQLMKLNEELNHKISEKDHELSQYKSKMEYLNCNIDEHKIELEKKYEEKVKNIENMYDTMMLEQIRNSDTALNVLNTEKCELQKQIASCQQSYEQKSVSYREELNTLLEKNKRTGEIQLLELEKYKQEADKYKQQLENFENLWSKEVQKIKNDCYLELSRYKSEQNSTTINNEEKIQYYQEEINKLSNQLQQYALSEASREVELETIKNELKKREDIINAQLNDLEKYEEVFLAQTNQIAHLNSEVSRSRDSNSFIHSELYKFQRNELKLLDEIKSSAFRIEEYKQEIFALKEQIKCLDENNKFNEEVKQSMKTNEALHEEAINQLTSEVNEQKDQIKNLQAKILHLKKLNLVTSGELTSIKQLGDDLMPDTANKQYLLNIRNGLIKIESQVKTFFESSRSESIVDSEQSHTFHENSANIITQEVTLEIEKTMGNILDMTQYLQQSRVELLPSVSQCLLTLTPNISHNSDRIVTGTNTANNPERCDFQSSKIDVNNCTVNHSKLKEENAALKKTVQLLMDNQTELESCLLVVSKESNQFNEKCRILDEKLTELENSKLSEHLLKKENDELKQQLKNIEESEKRLNNELSVLHENNMKLEKKINENISVVLQNLENSNTNSELKSLLTDLKEKTNEIIHLKSQVSSLQTADKEQRSRILHIQSQYEYLNTKYKFLSGELNSKAKQLDEMCMEKYKISTVNKILLEKLDVQGNFPSKLNFINSNETKSVNNNNITSESDDDQIQEFDTEVYSIPEALHENDNERMESSELICSCPNLTHPKVNGVKNILSLPHLDKKYSLHKLWKFEKQDKEDNPLNYHMPTIMEEDDTKEDNQNDQERAQNQVFLS